MYESTSTSIVGSVVLTSKINNQTLQTVIRLPTRSLSASSSAPSGQPAYVGVGVSYAAGIYPPHEHPTNMRIYGTTITTPPPNMYEDRTLFFTFVWDSTGGNVYGQDLSDLSQTQVEEYVTYSGDGSNAVDAMGNPVFIPVSPPFPLNWAFSNPSTGGTDGNTPPLYDEHDHPSPFTHFFSAAQFTGTQ